jgi:hypothetical protein
METKNQTLSKSKIWIFTCSRPLTEGESDDLLANLNNFLKSWNTHGLKLLAEGWIELNQILIVSLDENFMAASGCSIDKLNRFVSNQSEALKVNFFDRLTVFYQDENKTKSTNLATFWALRKANTINDETLVLDTTIKTFEDWKMHKWKQFQNSWHKSMYGR